MKLSVEGLRASQWWKENNYILPKAAPEELETCWANTRKNPTWLHFGAGNIFRIFPAAVLQDLLDQNAVQTGVIVAEAYDQELISKCYRPYDNLSLAVTLKQDGSVDKKIVAGIAESLMVDDPENRRRLTEIFSSPSLQMVSYTITEKGYSLTRSDGSLSEAARQDMAFPAEVPVTLMGLTARLLLDRFQAGGQPVAMVSMDNCSHNGDKLKEAVLTIAWSWQEKGHVSKDFLQWLSNPETVSFPWSMIDKITPRPAPAVADILTADGLEDVQPIQTAKNTWASCFVNGEETQYLVVEDAFPNGRPPLEKGGVLFCDRQTVDRVEKMKVCTCLNPLHTALSVYGCLLGYKTIAEEMKDPLLKELIRRIGYQEGMPVVVDPGVLSPKEFIDCVVEVRLPNPFIPDTPERISCDNSQKIPVRFGETLKAYQAKGMDVTALTCIPLFFAGWIRELMAVNDRGEAFSVSPDPLLSELQESVSGLRFGSRAPFNHSLRPLLSNDKIFGIDLVKAGLAEKVEGYLEELLEGPGAVRKTLEKYLG